MVSSSVAMGEAACACHAQSSSPGPLSSYIISDDYDNRLRVLVSFCDLDGVDDRMVAVAE